MEIREIQRDELPQLLALYRHLHPDGWLERARRTEDLQATRRPAITSWWQEEGRAVSTCTLLSVPNLTHLAALRTDVT